jgi:nitrous oxidase accessory protein
MLPTLVLFAVTAQAAAGALQARIDAASDGAVIEVDSGTYVGDLTINRPLRLVGRGRPVLVGTGGSVVSIRADDVTIESFDIDGRAGRNIVDDAAGVHVAGRRALIRDCRIDEALFGVYLYEADDTRVEANVIRGRLNVDPGDQGNGIHVFNTHGFTLADNTISGTRDGLYIQNSPGGRIARNHVHDLRYAVHYMYSDDNVFEDNLFEHNAAGAAVMYSKRVHFARNRLLHNRGVASVGLLLQACEEVVAEENLVADNVRGVFLESGRANVFRRNLIAESDVSVVLYDSTRDTRFEGNAFVGNLSPLELVGRRTDTRFDGNYWSADDDPDLDGDGVRDRAYRLSNVFDHLRGNMIAADLFAQGLGAAVLASAERTFPVLDVIPVVDAHPLAKPPALREVPSPPPAAGNVAVSGLVESVALLGAGAIILAAGRRHRAPEEPR